MVSVPTTDDITHPLSAGYDLRINNTLWQLAPTAEEAIDVIPVDDAAQRAIQTQENPEDFGVAPDERSFSRESFAGGEGLARAHRRDGAPSDYSRFWASDGLEVEPTFPGDPERLRLAPAPDTLDTFAGAGRIELATVDATLFAVRDTAGTVARYDDPTDPLSPPTEETVDAAATSIDSMARIGRELYVSSVGQGIYQRSVAGVWSSFLSPFEADRLWSAKLRLLGRGASASHELYEVASAGESLVVSMTDGSEWHDVVDAGEYILAAGSDGFIYAIGEEGGNLVVEAQSEMEGEEPVSVAVAQGVVFVATRQATPAGGYIGRLWRASMDGPRLVGGQVVRTWGDMETAEDHTPSQVYTTRATAEVWVRDRIWHYHLESAGLHSWMASPNGAGTVVDLTVLGGRTFASILYDGADDPAVFFQTNNFTTSGWLITAAADFFTTAPKDWVGLSLFHGQLASTHSIRVFYTTNPQAITDPDHDSWTLATTRIGPSSKVDDEVALVGVRSRWLAVKILVESATAASSPEVLGFSVRAQITTPDVQVVLPINISDWVDSPWRSRRRAPGLGRVRQSTLFGLRSSVLEVELFRRSEVVRGRVVHMSRPETVTTPGGSATLRAMLVVKGKVVGDTTGTSTVTGTTWGVPLYGDSLFGGD